MTLAVRDFPTLPPEALLRAGRSALAGNADDEDDESSQARGSRVAGGKT